MSSVIKSTELATMPGVVRKVLERQAHADVGRPAEPLPPGEVLALRRELGELAQRLGERDAELERLRESVQNAYREGETEGRKQGRQESDQRRADYLAALERGLDAACNRFSEDLRDLERLAVLVARESLAKILGDDESRKELLAEAIGSQLRRIEAGSVVAVQVSRADFPEPEELTRLADSLGGDRLALVATDELRAGECRIKLKLGALDVGLPQQWERLDRALQTLADTEAAA